MWAGDWRYRKSVSGNFGPRDDNVRFGRKTEVDTIPSEAAYVVEAEDMDFPRKDSDELAEVLGLDKVIGMVGHCNSSLGAGTQHNHMQKS